MYTAAHDTCVRTPTQVGTPPTEAQHPQQPHTHQHPSGARPWEALGLPGLAGAPPCNMLLGAETELRTPQQTADQLQAHPAAETRGNKADPDCPRAAASTGLLDLGTPT